MQRGIQVRVPPEQTADTRAPELAEPSAAGATRPPRKQGTKPVMEFNLACCITCYQSPIDVAYLGRRRANRLRRGRCKRLIR